MPKIVFIKEQNDICGKVFSQKTPQDEGFNSVFYQSID